MELSQFNNNYLKLPEDYKIYYISAEDNDNITKEIDNNVVDPELNQTLKTLAENEFDRTLFKKYGELSEEKRTVEKILLTG